MYCQKAIFILFPSSFFSVIDDNVHHSKLHTRCSLDSRLTNTNVTQEINIRSLCKFLNIRHVNSIWNFQINETSRAFMYFARNSSVNIRSFCKNVRRWISVSDKVDFILEPSFRTNLSYVLVCICMYVYMYMYMCVCMCTCQGRI